MLTVTLPNQRLVDLLGPAPEGVEYKVWDLTDRAAAPAGPIDLAVMPYMAPASILNSLRGLAVKAVQSQALGFNGVDAVLDPSVAFSYARGVHEGATAEHAISLILAAQREIPQFVHEQDAAGWDQRFTPGLAGRTVLLIGAGGVGEALRRRLEGFEATVVRSAAYAYDDAAGHVYGPEDLPRLIAQADVVAVAVPLTDSTFHLIDAAALAAMKEGALLVNIGRGPVVDTDALVPAVKSGHIRAALDVMDPEPLPADHELWHTPGVLITPHVAGRTTTMDDRIVALLRRQVGHLLAGEPLEFLVDFQR